MKFQEVEEIEVLGTKYKLEFQLEIVDEDLGFLQGLCDIDEKIIFILDTLNPRQQAITLKHELLHAFLFESGLYSSSLTPQEGWAVNEEMIDFFALQWDKINKIFKELQILEV